MTSVTARALTACRDVEPLLSTCVDGELLEDDRAAVRAHIQSCDACRARLASLEALKRAVARAPRPTLPPALEAQIKRDVRAVARRGRLARAGIFFAGVAAAAAAVFVLVPAHQAAPPGPSAVLRAAVERHRLDLPVDVASPDPRRVQEFLAARVGPLRVPRLDPHGFGLRGARVVDVAEHRGAQLVYTGGYGQRLSVTALADPDGSLAAGVHAPFSMSQDGLAVRVIETGGELYTLVGDVDDGRLQRVEGELER